MRSMILLCRYLGRLSSRGNPGLGFALHASQWNDWLHACCRCPGMHQYFHAVGVAVGKRIGKVWLRATEYSHWGLIGVDHALGQQLFTQRIDQSLELHAGLSDPLHQCRASNRQSY